MYLEQPKLTPMMLNRHQEKTISVTIFILCSAAIASQGQEELPIKISTVTIPGTISECPADVNRQAFRDLLLNSMRGMISQIFGSLYQECGPGNWRRVFYLNASRADQQSCPGQWNLVTTPVKGCAGANSLCHSAFSDGINTAYSKVCGRIIGESVNTPDAFHRFIANQNTIEGNYLDGVSVTHGASGSRTHIWSFGAGHPAGGGLVARCPKCDSDNRTQAPLPPAEVGNNYFCDRADGFDPLWTGESCTNNNPCCSSNNPPYFSVQLPASTTNSIELRLCTDQRQADETVLVLFAEIYVQ